MPDLNATRESINKLGTDMVALMAKAKEEKRELSADEAKTYDAMDADREQSLATERRLLKTAEIEQGTGRRSEPPAPSGRGPAANPVTEEERQQGLQAWMLAGSSATVPETLRQTALRCGINIDSPKFTLRLPSVALRADTWGPDNSRVASDASVAAWEKRAAMGIGSGAIGQYTVADAAMQSLERALLMFGGVRSVATVIRTDTGGPLPFPTSDDTANKGVILAENTTAVELDVTFGQMVLDSFKYSSKYVLVSVELLQDSSVNVAELIGRALGERIGRITNDHFTTGTTAMPQGIVTASTAGVTGIGAVPTYDNFVDLVHSVDPAYRQNAKFMLNDNTLKAVKKIKVLQYSGDLTGIPLWSPSMTAGQPDAILGYPFVINQSMASAGAGAKVVIFGDLSKYMIRDVRDITLLRLDERFAEFHQVAFLAFSRHDGDLLDAGTHPVKHMAQA